MSIAIVLGLLIIAIILFASEITSVDVVTILILIILCLTKTITPQEAFSGFSSDFIIILASIFIMVGALKKTGVIDNFIARVINIKKQPKNLLLFFLMIITAISSAFMNNTTITALMLNPTIGLSKISKVAPSKMLMPLAFASILGGTCTLIGTSTNVAVSGYLAQRGLEELGIFSFLGLGLILLVIGIAFMMTIGQKLLPTHNKEELEDDYAVRKYLSEIVVLENSKLIGQKVFESEISKRGFVIISIVRNKHKFIPNRYTRLNVKDTLIVRGNIEELLKIKELEGVEIKADLLDLMSDESDLHLAEIMVIGNSEIIRSTVENLNFRVRYGVSIVAIYRKGITISSKIGKLKLRVGDLILVQGNKENIDLLRSKISEFIILEDYKPEINLRRKGIATLFFFILSIVLGTTGLVPLSIAFLNGALLTVITKCINPSEVYEDINWKLLVLIGGMSAFSIAMTKTGADKFVANYIIDIFEPFGKTGILAGFVVLTVLLTQPLSNAAAALVVLPIAISTAEQLQINPVTFAVGIMLAASVSLLTPFEPSCILVYGPGKYRFFDFVKVGGLLTLILIAIIVAFTPKFFPF